MNQILSKNVYALRKKKDIRVSDLAKITGIDEDKLTKIECGMEDASFDEIKKLAEFYRVEVPELMGELLISENNSNAKQGAQDVRVKYKKPSKTKNIAIIILSAILFVDILSIWDIVDSSILLTSANFTYGGYARVSAIIRLVTAILEIISGVALCIIALVSIMLSPFISMIFLIFFGAILAKAIIKIKSYKEVKVEN